MDTERFLITTADERSWKFDRPVLFLGEWCRLYHRKEVWSGMDAKVAEPFGLGKERKENDRSYLRSLKAKLLSEITDSMNDFHQTNYSQRYWNIVLGYWLYRFLNVAFNRYFSLEKALKENKISGTIIFNQPDYNLTTFTSLDFLWALYDDKWNHVFYVRVLNFLGSGEFESYNLPENEQNGFLNDENIANDRNIRNTIRGLWNLMGEKLSRKNDAVIVTSYLPFSYAVKLQLILGQFPCFWESPKLQNEPVNSELRSNFKIGIKGLSGFELFARTMLVETLPTCYLEGYSQLVEQSQSLPWPQKPKFIFTSNKYDSDEIFKIWTAAKAEKGYKYYIGQHGNNYGTWVYLAHDIPEYSTPDKFISWGWKNENPKIVPAFIFKTANRKPASKLSKGGLLLIERYLYVRFDPHDRHVDYDIYQKEQFRFIESLQANVQELLTVRLFIQPRSNLSWSDEQRWRDYNPNIHLDLGVTDIWDEIKNNRLIINSYDSTCFLETLSLNFPTIGFWNGLFDEILPEARSDYELLRDAGILFETPEEAAEFINMNWDKLDEWWYSKIIQDARITFCNKYAKTIASPIRELKKILTAVS